MAWEIGNGKSVRIGEDPWAGAGEDYKLPPAIIDKLKEQRCFKLADASVNLQYPHQRWKTAEELGLSGDERESWGSYVHLLETNFINLNEEDQDKLIWTRNSTNGEYTAKTGYEIAITEQTEVQKEWWWGCCGHQIVL